jgi:flavin-dependent dehydrogenase
MQTCDVLIAGGGPAGAACAGRLARAGLDVLVVDRAVFPRDKVCAGWVTPQGIADLQLDLDEYRRGRTLQPFTAFRVGLIGGGAVDVSYDHPVSFGIRRCEFDDYLLRRSGARLQLGTPIAGIRRDAGGWIVNDAMRARVLVGAGGHFCPVARLLNGPSDAAPLVVAQEAEFPIDSRTAGAFTVLPERPELYFSRALDGYGWCIRKEQHVNIGFGRLNRRGLPASRADFLAFLRARNAIPDDEPSWCWRGHAYLLCAPGSRRVVDDGALLVGDAAGLAYPQSGEGIRPAIESGLMAAEAIICADGRYTRDRLEAYERRLHERFGAGGASRLLAEALPPWAAPALARWLLRSRRFVRHIVLDRWFLHARDAALDHGDRANGQRVIGRSIVG